MLLILSVAPIYLLLSYVVSEFAGSPKKIGRWWTLFFCITLTPVIGLIFALCSQHKHTVVIMSPFVETTAYVLSVCSLLVGLITIFIGIGTKENQFPYFLVGSGFCGGNIYGIWKVIQTPKRDDL